MNFSFIKWFIPIVLELFKGNGRYPAYFKRNKTIALLLFACLTCFFLTIFMFEQAILHGVSSKRSGDRVVELSKKENVCNAKLERLSDHCG